MSWCIKTIEEIRVNNTCDATREIATEIGKYIQDFNHMENLGSLDINELSLVLDGAEYSVRDSFDHRGCDAYICNEDGFNLVQPEMTIFEEDNELILALSDIEKAKQICFKMSYWASVYPGVEYGIGRWYFDSENEDLFNNIEYRVVQFYDQEDAVSTYVFGRGVEETISDSDMSLVSSVEKWDVHSINVVVNGKNDEKISDEVAELLTNWTEGFVAKYDGCNPSRCDEYEFFYDDSIWLPADKLGDFLADVQKLVDIANEHSLYVVVVGNITAEAPSVFEAVRLKPVDGKLVTEFIKL